MLDREEAKHRNIQEHFYRVKVRFSANEHAKMYRKEENDQKDKKVFLLKIVFLLDFSQ